MPPRGRPAVGRPPRRRPVRPYWPIRVQEDRERRSDRRPRQNADRYGERQRERAPNRIIRKTPGMRSAIFGVLAGARRSFCICAPLAHARRVIPRQITGPKVCASAKINLSADYRLQRAPVHLPPMRRDLRLRARDRAPRASGAGTLRLRLRVCIGG